MLNLIRLTFAILVIVLIVPQTPTENALLRLFYETRIFANSNYGQTKKILNFLTWICIFSFLIITFTNGFR
jgi:preprotein translocase subunit SecG